MLAVALLVLSPLVPGMIARFGFRPLVIGAFMMEALCFLVLPLDDSLWFWMLVRIGMGASATVLFVASETWVNDVANDSSRGRVIGIYVTMLSLTFALGPLMVPVFGFTGWPPFLAAATLLMLAGVPLLLVGHIAKSGSAQHSGGVVGFLRSAPLLCAAVLLFAFLDGAALALLPVFGLRVGFDADTAATLITARASGSVCMQYPLGWLADRVDRRRLMLTCGLGSLIGAVALPFCVGTPMLFWPVLFLWGGVSVGVYTIAMVLLGERYQGRDLATGNAAFGVLWGIGMLTGPLAGGAAMTVAGPYGLPGLMAAASLAFLAFALSARNAR